MNRLADTLFRKTLSDIDEANLPIRAEQIRARLRNYPLMVGSQMLVAPLLCALMWQAVAHTLLLGWLALVYGVHLMELGYWAIYHKASNTLAECKRWRGRFILSVTVIGLLWGSAGAVMFVADDLAYQALLICVILGLAAGAVATNPVFPPALYIYVGLLILPVLSSSLLVGDVTHLVVASMLAVYLLFVLNAGLDLAKTFELSLRQPMHALTLFVEVLKNREHDEQAAHLIGQIEFSAEVMGGMFDALLDISRLDAGVIQPHYENFAIQQLLDNMREEFSWLARDKGLRFEVLGSDALVYSDSQLLERILRNLISNAIRYTEHGEVAVICREVAEGLRIQVRDSGIGIAPDHLPYVFEEYYQVGNRQRDRSKGLGLGLAIVKRLDQLLGCQLTLDSTVGEGSCFSFVVPLAQRHDVMIAPVESV